MKTTAQHSEAKPENILTLPPVPSRLGRIPLPTTPGATAARRQRFRILDFSNRTGTKSFRVQGMTDSGRYVRENFKDWRRAEARRLELENEYLCGVGSRLEIPRVTELTEAQLRIAETAFKELRRMEAQDADLLYAVQSWKRTGRERQTGEGPRLDDAVEQFDAWLKSSDCELRPRTRANLRVRVSIFSNTVRNSRLSDITPDSVSSYITGRALSKRTAINDRLALSKFFAWCTEPPRRWLSTNPARKEIRERRRANPTPPAVLTVDEAERLLRAAETYRNGRLLPYFVACLFGGIRPTEAERMTWTSVNLKDGEIRLEAHETKTARPRVIAFNDGPPEQKPFNAALRSWLEACKARPFFRPSWKRHLAAVKQAAGFGNPQTDEKLKLWNPDAMRHTSISHYFRLTGSYGRTAEMFGNSEAVVKQFYQARVSSADAAKFYAMRPTRS